MSDKQIVGAMVDPDIKKKLYDLAYARGMSINQYLGSLVTEAVKKGENAGSPATVPAGSSDADLEKLKKLLKTAKPSDAGQSKEDWKALVVIACAVTALIILGKLGVFERVFKPTYR